MLLVLLVAAASQPTLCLAARGRDAPRRVASPLHLRGEAFASADLQVGTEPGKANVVSGFEVVSAWSSGDDLASSVPPTERATSLYLRPSGGSLQLARAAVEPAILPHLRTSLEGKLAQDLAQQGQVNLRPDKDHLLSIAYDCRSQGEASLTLTLEFEGLSAVQIPLKKTCGGEKNTALTVTVGSSGDGDKVVIMGTPKWDELKVIGVRPTSSVFTVSVDPLSEKGAQVISTPTATGVGACSAQVATPTSGAFKKKNLAPGDSVDVEVEYRCFRHGKCIVTAEVPFFPYMAPYQPLRWSWTKLCGGEALGIDVEVPETRRSLAKDGVAKMSASGPWIVENNVTDHTVRLVNDQTRSLESEVKVRSLTVRCLDSKRCSSRILETVPATLNANSPTDLHVKYTCRSSGSSVVQLFLALEGHDPVVVTWAKDCDAFADSFVGVVLWMVFVFTCLACACVGCVKMFFDGAASERGKQVLEGEFVEDEKLTKEEVTALDRYEECYGLQRGAASIEQVKDSSLGVAGWAAKPPLGQA